MPSKKAKRDNASKLLLLLAVIAAVIVLGYFVGADKFIMGSSESESANIIPPPREIVADLTAQNNSGQNGSATFVEDGSLTKVKVLIVGAPLGLRQPAHVHVGACPKPGAVKYPLSDVVDGFSETVLDVPLTQLEGEKPLAVNVHKSTTQLVFYTACGDL